MLQTANMGCNTVANYSNKNMASLNQQEGKVNWIDYVFFLGGGETIWTLLSWLCNWDTTIFWMVDILGKERSNKNWMQFSINTFQIEKNNLCNAEGLYSQFYSWKSYSTWLSTLFKKKWRKPATSLHTHGMDQADCVKVGVGGCIRGVVRINKGAKGSCGGWWEQEIVQKARRR